MSWNLTRWCWKDDVISFLGKHVVARAKTEPLSLSPGPRLVSNDDHENLIRPPEFNGKQMIILLFQEQP